LNGAQLAQTTFVAGAAGTSDDLFAMATDGQQNSNNNVFTEFHVAAAASIGAGAQLEVADASSSKVTFLGATGTLILDHAATFTGQIIDLTGNGNLSSSDQIDLEDIAFGSGTTESYSGNPSGGTLTISDAQGHVANLTLVGNYTNSTFMLSSDGHGGTTLIDPPKDGFNFAFAPVLTNGPSVRVGGVGNDVFPFYQAAAVAPGSSDSLALDGFGSKVVSSNLSALMNGAQSDHQWTDAGHDAGLGHLDNVRFAGLHAADFMIH
jgi:hypothetical protein